MIRPAPLILCALSLCACSATRASNLPEPPRRAAASEAPPIAPPNQTAATTPKLKPSTKPKAAPWVPAEAATARRSRLQKWRRETVARLTEQGEMMEQTGDRLGAIRAYRDASRISLPATSRALDKRAQELLEEHLALSAQNQKTPLQAAPRPALQSPGRGPPPLPDDYAEASEAELTTLLAKTTPAGRKSRATAGAGSFLSLCRTLLGPSPEADRHAQTMNQSFRRGERRLARFSRLRHRLVALRRQAKNEALYQALCRAQPPATDDAIAILESQQRQAQRLANQAQAVERILQLVRSANGASYTSIGARPRALNSRERQRLEQAIAAGLTSAIRAQTVIERSLALKALALRSERLGLALDQATEKALRNNRALGISGLIAALSGAD